MFSIVVLFLQDRIERAVQDIRPGQAGGARRPDSPRGHGLLRRHPRPHRPPADRQRRQLHQRGEDGLLAGGEDPVQAQRWRDGPGAPPLRQAGLLMSR